MAAVLPDPGHSCSGRHAVCIWELKSVILEFPENSSLEPGLIFSKPDVVERVRNKRTTFTVLRFFRRSGFRGFYLGTKEMDSVTGFFTGSLRFILTYDPHFWQMVFSKMSKRLELRCDDAAWPPASAGSYSEGFESRPTRQGEVRESQNN